MPPNTAHEEKIVFAVSPEGQGDSVPVLLLGIPEGAWNYIRDGKTNSFDLTKVGLPLKLIVFGAKDHRDAMAMIDGTMKLEGVAYVDARNVDFSIKPRDGDGTNDD